MAEQMTENKQTVDNASSNDASSNEAASNEASSDETLEELLTKVETYVQQLENPQISLEDSFRCYEQGLRTLKRCNELVEHIEQRMLVLNSQGELEEFD